MSPVRLNGSTSGYTELAAPAVAGNNTLVLPASGVTIATLIPGEVKWFAMVTPPSGFLKANGLAISRTTYASLFAAIGTLYGVGDGSTTFNLPDLRGEFIRGFDDGRGIDTGRTLGSFQASSYASHTHTATVSDPGHSHSYTSRTTTASNAAAGAGGAANAGNTTGVSVTGITVTNAASGGTDTLPRNIALLACIAY